MPPVNAKVSFALLSLFSASFLTACGEHERLARSIEITKSEIALAEQRLVTRQEEESELESEVLGNINAFVTAGGRNSGVSTMNSARVMMAKVSEELTIEAEQARKKTQAAATKLEQVRKELAAYQAHLATQSASK